MYTISHYNYCYNTILIIAYVYCYVLEYQFNTPQCSKCDSDVGYYVRGKRETQHSQRVLYDLGDGTWQSS